ncbi:S-adenosyl-L-methionine-dependent methyltransferase [Xylariaceae sp. FL1272]|nr:S-adenosyl-L-methionine-dependent methyltransferase [Xylariaceae sp. FL1272]
MATPSRISELSSRIAQNTAKVNELLCQQAIIRYRLVHAVPLGGEATFAEIADTTVALTESDVRQIIRRAILEGVFTEIPPGIVSHNAVSRLLAENNVLHDWVGANVDELWPASAHACDAIDKWPASEEPTETGFALANNTTKSMYEFFSDHPERARRFANAMRAHGDRAGLDPSHTVQAFTWSKLSDAKVIDVGGSYGNISIAIARAYPSLTFVVQDLEPVIEEAKKSVPDDVAGRFEFMTHSFFTPQPVHDAIVYLFRWILHNWTDRYALNILRNLVPALRPGTRILIQDVVLPAPGSMSNYEEIQMRSTDLTQKVIQKSHERELNDWKRLASAADDRYKFEHVARPRCSALTMMAEQGVNTKTKDGISVSSRASPRKLNEEMI